MLTVTQMVCRKCPQVFPLAVGAICPQCYSNLHVVTFVESGQTPDAPDAPRAHGQHWTDKRWSEEFGKTSGSQAAPVM